MTAATRPDEITVRDTSSSFLPTPEGQHQAVAVDVIDLGERVEAFQGQDPKVVHKVAIVYQIEEINPENQERFTIAVEKTLSFHPRAGLRKWLEAWRGKAYSDDEARKQGAPLHKLVGANCFIVVEHKRSKKDRTYGVASNIMPKPKNVPALEATDYTRAEYWNTRKEEYAKSVAAFRSFQSGGNGQDQPPAVEPEFDDDDDLPF